MIPSSNIKHIFFFKLHRTCMHLSTLFCILILREYLCEILSCFFYGLNDREVGVRVTVGSRIFTSPNRLGRLWGPPQFLPNWYRGPLSPVVKQPGRESDHSSPTTAKVNKTWIYTPIPPYVFMA
jgi:hypothetical protein